MSMMRKSQVAAAATAAALVALPASAVASYAAHAGPGSATAAPVNRQISLKGSKAYPKATGSAQYQSQQRQREVEVQHVRSLAGKRVVFSVAGRTLGQAKVSPSGHADITRNTEKGQKVPTVTHGWRVTVRTTGGTLIVSRRF